MPARPALAAALLLGVALGPAPAAADAGVPLPPRSRAVDGPGGLVASGQGFRQTVDFYERFLKRRGLAHEQVPVYRHRGVDVARFLSRQRGSRWRAIHVFRHTGQTFIAVVPEPPSESEAPLTDEEPRGRKPSPEGD
jgi:hypothetical protein